MDLGLDLKKPVGRPPTRELVAEEVGELTVEDLSVLELSHSTKALPLKRLSERHHGLARALAGGMAPGEAAYAYGYRPASVSILQADAAFKDLIEHYRAIPDAMYADLHQRLSGMSIDAADEITRRMEEDANRDEGEQPQMSTGQLLNILTIGADRTGYGPATKSTHVHLHGGLAVRLEAARKRVAKMLDITPDNVSGTGSANGVDEIEPLEIKHERTG